MTYTEEQRAADIKIAAAMGWRDIHDGIGLPPLGSTVNDQIVGEDWGWSCPIPLFHTGENAQQMLLEWLTADPSRWAAFIEQLTVVLMGQRYMLCPELLRRMVMASPDQFLEAVMRVLKEME